MNDIIKNGGISVFKAFGSSNPNYATIILSQLPKTERPYERSTPQPKGRLAKSRNHLLSNTLEGGYETNPITYPLLVAKSKVPNWIEVSNLSGKEAPDLYEQNLDGDKLLSELGFGKMVINTYETTNLAEIKEMFIKYIEDNGEEVFIKHVHDKIMKRSARNKETGEQYFLVNNGLPVFKETELVSVEESLGDEYVEFTHYVSLDWRIGQDVNKFIVKTREEGRISNNSESFAEEIPQKDVVA